MGAIENVLGNTRLMNKLCSITHLLCMCSICRHSFQLRYDGEVIIVFARLSIGSASCFLAIGAFSEVLIWSNKADTAIYTTAISHRLESSKRPNTLLGHFKGFMTGIWECLGKSVESAIWKVILDFECVSAEQV